jgi:hypothetical protein
MSGSGPIDLNGGDESVDEVDEGWSAGPRGIRRRVSAGFSSWWANPKKRYGGIAGGIVLLIAVLFAVPYTRYELLALGVKEPVTVTVVDSKSGKPVSGVVVRIGDKEQTTDESGVVTFRVRPGKTNVSLSKDFYQSTKRSFTVTLSRSHNRLRQPILALGRHVPIKVVDAVSGKPLAGTEITSGGGETKTDATGQATITVASSATSQDASIQVDGYKTQSLSITITNDLVAANTVRMIPTGTVDFLSNKSGTIDVVSSDLDGGNRRIILAGTGNEEPGTVLTPSPDGQYLALLSRRTGGNSSTASVYVIDTTNKNQLTTVDKGAATFQVIGWSGSHLIYVVNRNNAQIWEPNRQAIKSYNATSGKTVTLGQASGAGTGVYNFASSTLSEPIPLKNEVVYLVSWQTSYSQLLAGQSASLVSIKPDGSARRTIKAVPVPAGVSYYSLSMNRYAPNGVYLQVPSGTDNTKTTYEYEDGTLSAKTLSDTEFYKAYGPYYVAPSGNATLWAETRDGINTLLIGDSGGANGKVIASLKDYSPLGWFSEKYLLLSKSSSELYLVAADGSGSPLKVNDYYVAPSEYR